MKYLLVLYLLRAWQLPHIIAYPKCMSVITPDINKCRRNGLSSLLTSKCVPNDICNKTFNIAVVKLEPISSVVLPGIISYLLNYCCGDCTGVYQQENVTDVNAAIANAMFSPHFVYPVISYSKVTELHGFKFLPLLPHSEIYYISRKAPTQFDLPHLAVSCAKLWPLLLICLLIALIAGVPVWLIETLPNRKEPPTSFFVGLFDGFWRCFLAMTTTGYSDKAPKFVVARLMAAIWILVGICISASFTATLTAETIVSAATPGPPTMEGNRVGIVKGRFHDALLVTKKGGYAVESTNGDALPALFDLVTAVQNNSISGFVIDEYMYTYVLLMLNNVSLVNKQQQERASYFQNELLHRKQKRQGEIMYYGMLVKHLADYEYFRPFLDDNRYTLETCRELHMQSRSHVGERTRVTSSSGGESFMKTLYVVLAIATVIVVGGGVYEIVRNTCRKHSIDAKVIYM